MTSASAIALTPSVKPTAPFAASRPISVSSRPGQSLGGGGVGVDLGELHLARAAREELDNRHVVDRRLGVRQRHHRRDARRRRRPARRFRSIPCARRRARAAARACRRSPAPGTARRDRRSRHRRPRWSPPTAAIRSPSTSRSPAASSPLAGSSSRAARNRRRLTAAAGCCRDRGSGSRGTPCAPPPPSRPAGE